MGMAASQVRFLSLQNRKNTIGLNLMTLSNRKTALSRDMSRVANEYNNAMNQKVLKWSNDSGVTYSDLTYDKLMKPNELNTTKPYIITDAQGRVVLDDNKITIDGVEKNITYRQLASMISAYSGLKDDKTSYDNTNGGTINVTKDASNKVTNVTTTAISGKANKDAYTIPTNALEYDFQNSLRYDLMTQLGLISEADRETFERLIKEQYGSDTMKKNGNYSGILADFDANRTSATNTYGDYADAFGELQLSAGAFKLNGGSNIGNLALAKAYLAEYKAYLNTDIKRDILVDSKKTIASSAASTSELDKQNTTNPAEFAYNKDANTGISNRMLGLLSQTGEVTKTGNDYQLKVSGILNHLGFYDASGNISNPYDAVSFEEYHYDRDNIGRFDECIDKASITSWGQLYDVDGGLGPTGGQSYDIDGDGYINGSDYVNQPGNNPTTGVSIRGNSEYDKRSFDKYQEATDLYKAIDCFANSLKQIDNINEAGVNYAQRMTKQLYQDEYNQYGVRHEEGPSGNAASRNAAAGAADSLFGFGYDTIGGHTDPVAYNVTNMLNAFITFYEMYVAVDGDESRIHAGASGGKTYSAEFNNLASNYNNNFVDDMKDNVDIMASAFDSFMNDEEDATVTNDDSGTHNAGDTVTITYTRTSKDDEGNDMIDKLRVTGLWGTSGFSSIQKLEYLTGEDKTTQAFEYSVDSSNNKTLTQTTYDNDGNLDNTVIYNVNNDGTSNATITFAQRNDLGVNTILINNGSVSTVNGSADLERYKVDEKAYYIAKEGSTTAEADPNYKYKLVMGDEGVLSSVFAGTITTKPTDKYSAQLEQLVTDCQQKVDDTAEEIQKIYATFERKGMDYFDALFKMISQNGWVYDEAVNNPDDPESSKNYLNAKLQNNMYFITEVDTLDGTDFNYATKLATNVSKVFQVYDTDAQNTALSKYESEKADINAKEKQIDIRMNKLETEQDAIKTELDSIKSIIKDNVDSTFKIFT